MKNTYKYIITAILVTAIAFPVLAYGQEVGGAGVNGSDVNPSGNAGLSTGGGDTNGSNTGSGGLSTGGGNTNGSDVNPSGDPGLSVGGTGSNGSDVGPADTSTPGGDNGGSNGGSSSGSSSNGGGRGGSGGSNSTSVLPTISDLSQCVYLNSYLKLGRDNPQAEVLKLQAFLSSVENLPVLTTGVFDNQTFEGVKAFQAKYVTEILAPWGVTTPTGQVWYTTKKKVNEVFCKANFALTPAQIAEIEAYRLGIANGAVDAFGNPLDPNATGTIPLLPEVGNASGSNPLSAAVGDLSIFQKFVNFLKWLFHR
ncbi:MAG: peptidoglycan-binding domain-containing protein [Patescibacteria group bacterium]